MRIQPYQKTECRQFSDLLEIQLFKIFMKLNKEYGATYMSYTFDWFNSVRYSFRTDSRWSDVYHHEKVNGKPLIEICPLDIASRAKKNILLHWDLYRNEAQPKIYKEIMGMREDTGLQHGLTLSCYFHHHHDALAVATEDGHDDLATRLLILNKGFPLKESLISCRKIALLFFKNKKEPHV